MNIRTAAVSVMAISLFCLLPMTANAKKEKEIAAPTPTAQEQCQHTCQVTYGKCIADIKQKNCAKTLQACRDILCAENLTPPQ